jgi:RNA polymerase sigma factor (sigma-70 family)
VIDNSDTLRRFVDHNDAEAFRELVAAYHPMVYGVCRRVLGSRPATDDATHETFIKLSRHAATIRGNVGSWLYTCALNIARGARQSDLARTRRERDSSRPWSEPAESGFDEEEYALLNLCIAELDDGDRDIISQYFFLGLSQHEIAARTGLSQVGIKKRIDRALRSLRYRLVCHGFDLGPVSTTASGRLRQVSCNALPLMLAGTGMNPSLLCVTWCISDHRGAWRWVHALGRRAAEAVHGILLTSRDRLMGKASIYKSTRRRTQLRLGELLQATAAHAQDAGGSLTRLVGSRVGRAFSR